MARRDPLVLASAAFALANVLHTIDHQRQGTERLSPEIFAGGTALTIGAVLVLVLAIRGDARAALAAAVIGLASATGVAAAHIAPEWSAFSDPYPGGGQDALSWAIMLLELGAAAVLGDLGLRRVARPRPVEA